MTSRCPAQGLFLAVLLKHSSLWKEAKAALLEVLASDAAHSDVLHDAAAAIKTEPSKALRDAWVKVKQVRKYLDVQHVLDRNGDLKNALRVGDVESEEDDVSDADVGAEQTPVDAAVSACRACCCRSGGGPVRDVSVYSRCLACTCAAAVRVQERWWS